MDGCRVATQADLPRLVELTRAVTAELAPTRGGAVWKARDARAEPLAENLGDLLGQPDNRVLVGTIDGLVMGLSLIHISEPTRPY